MRHHESNGQSARVASRSSCMSAGPVRGQAPEPHARANCHAAHRQAARRPAVPNPARGLTPENGRARGICGCATLKPPMVKSKVARIAPTVATRKCQNTFSWSTLIREMIRRAKLMNDTNLFMQIPTVTHRNALHPAARSATATSPSDRYAADIELAQC